MNAIEAIKTPIAADVLSHLSDRAKAGLVEFKANIDNKGQAGIRLPDYLSPLNEDQFRGTIHIKIVSMPNVLRGVLDEYLARTSDTEESLLECCFLGALTAEMDLDGTYH